MDNTSKKYARCQTCKWEGPSGDMLVDWNMNDEMIFRCPRCNGVYVLYKYPVILESAKMLPGEFYEAYRLFAKETEEKTKVPYLFTLAQAALESDWAARIKENNFFGNEDNEALDGDKKDYLITDFNKRKRLKIKRWLKKYVSPEGSFTDQARYLQNNKRYEHAFKFTNPLLFAKEIAKAGFTTDPLYYEKMEAIIIILKQHQLFAS